MIFHSYNIYTYVTYILLIVWVKWNIDYGFFFSWFRLQTWLFQTHPCQFLHRGRWEGGRLRSRGLRTLPIAKSHSASAGTACSRKHMNYLCFVMQRLLSLFSLAVDASMNMLITGIYIYICSALWIFFLICLHIFFPSQNSFELNFVLPPTQFFVLWSWLERWSVLFLFGDFWV